MFAASKTFTRRVETPFSCRGHSVVTFDDRTLKFVVRFERHVSQQYVAQREMPLLTIQITQQSRYMSIRLCDMWFARVFVNMRQKHVILLTTYCVLDRQPIRKRGCVSWAGPRWCTVEHSIRSATRRFAIEKCSSSNYHPSFDIIES